MKNFLFKSKKNRSKLSRQTSKYLFIEALIVLCLIVTIEIVLIKAKKNTTYSSKVLGVASNQANPQTNTCQPDQCGFCRKCGNLKDNSCAQLTRCKIEKQSSVCKFDLSCLY